MNPEYYFQTAKKVVIAHRGASGYLPEHTLAGKALAHGMGSHYIEQDVVLTKDNHPIVLHDIYLDTVTDVASVFPKRCRDNGRFYAIDFTLQEIKQLRSSERINPLTGKVVFPTRFPHGRSVFGIATLEEEIELIQGLNKSRHREAGIYPELKGPRFHAMRGKNLSDVVLRILSEYGYVHKDGKCIIQCFDSDTIQQLRFEARTQLPLVQLIGDECAEWNDIQSGKLSFDSWLQDIAVYADGIAPDLDLIFSGKRQAEPPSVSALVNQAHDLGLFVHPFTVRVDALPSYARNFEKLLEFLYCEIGVDGLFTDFPDLAINYLETTGCQASV